MKYPKDEKTGVEVRFLLDLSTGHVPGPNPKFGTFRTCTHEHGWTVFLHDEWKDAPIWMLPTLGLAKRMGCSIINYDEAGSLYPDGLPVWEW